MAKKGLVAHHQGAGDAGPVPVAQLDRVDIGNQADTAYFNGLGCPTANKGRAGDIEFAYYDTGPLMGCMLEVVTRSEGLINRFAAIATAAAGRYGRDPIRT